MQPLQNIHDHVFSRFKPGDRLVYLGNYTGFGMHSVETVDEILSFRRALMAMEGVRASDIVYLRGAQEEMLQKLLQVQFAPNPRLVIEWLLNNGMAQTLESYGICLHTLWRVAGEGVVQLSRWTGYLRNMMRRFPGHETFSGQYVRAAYYAAQQARALPSVSLPAAVQQVIPPVAYMTETAAYEELAAMAAAGGQRGGRPQAGGGFRTFYGGQEAQDSAVESGYTPLLFVSAGVDYGRPLTDQGDTLWWGNDAFHGPRSYAPFTKVFRGFDPLYKGICLENGGVTLHNGEGIVGAAIETDGSVTEMFEA